MEGALERRDDQVLWVKGEGRADLAEEAEGAEEGRGC